uniref:Uncharacterized protein n=1 Tax=Anguilla anguilla TaxID=7936 RepID=A0A0E9RZY1_ANGAN
MMTLSLRRLLLSSGIRPNGDGTCQLRKSLDISNSTEASYSCEVPFGSLKRRSNGMGKYGTKLNQTRQ